tara:strand:- start:5242 stop:6129 length:888 start_codon:yes stop_codon:yes gene_type:complete
VKLAEIVKYITNLFEKKRKNPIQLERDSNLESKLKFLKVSNKATPIQISEDTVNIEGSLNVNGSAVQTGDDVGTITSLNNATENELVTVGATTTELDAEANLTFDGTGLKIGEVAAASSNTAGYGQIWVDDAAPNELAFTDDLGTDIVGIGKYHYDIKFIGYNAAQASSYLPITGYIFERTSTTNYNESVGFIAPYNGTIEKFCFRSEIAQDGNFRLVLKESSDATEVPASVVYRKDESYDIADDTYLELDLTSPGIGSDYMPISKGKIYAFELTTPSNSQDTNITIVFKWNVIS